MSEDELYAEAVTVIDETVSDVIDTLQSIADSHNYQFEWVIEKFRDRFNNKVRKVLH